MSIKQVKGASGTTVDRSLFVGARVPHEIQTMIKPLSRLDKATFTKILKVIVESLVGSQTDCNSIKSLVTDKLTEDTLGHIYSGLEKLLKQAWKISTSSLKKEHFLQDLQELQVPGDFHEDLASCVFGSVRSQIDERLEGSRPQFPSLDHLDWRVDVAISTGTGVINRYTLGDIQKMGSEHLLDFSSVQVLNRVLVRGVTVEMALSDGSIKDFEMSVSKFQDLRFQVASVLNEMEKLEKRSILKIKD